MKANLLRKYILPGAVGLVSGLGLSCMAGPGIIIMPPAPPTVVITAPMPPAPVVVAPAPTVAVVPDDYYYDGTEYVGIVGGQYYYLGPDSAWVVMDPVRLHRFNVWVGAHPDWRTHYVTHNVRYRGSIPAHAQPMHEDRAPARDYDHPDHDHDHNGPPH
jgi:hypothetical protein